MELRETRKSPVPDSFWSSEAGIHSERVAQKLASCDKDLGMSYQVLYEAGKMHDVGKFRLNYQILYKEGRLTDAERAHVNQHSAFGYEMLSAFSATTRAAALHHHDVDANEALYIQVLHLVDIEDALCNKRCYKAAMPWEKAERILREEAEKMSPAAQRIFWTHIQTFRAMDV